MTKCNYGKDKEIAEYDPYEDELSSSDFDSDDDQCGYQDGKPTKKASRLYFQYFAS